MLQKFIFAEIFEKIKQSRMVRDSGNLEQKYFDVVVW